MTAWNSWLFAGLAGWSAMIAAGGQPALGAGNLETPWTKGHSYEVRLIAGSAARELGGPQRTYAAIEIRMSPGWKTYWRSPGDAGGMAPRFDWAGSSNLASAEALYPAPKRYKDALGDAIGYSGSVLFPIEFRAKDKGKPVELKLDMEFGVCREICVPAEAHLSLAIPPGTAPPSSAIDQALALVPRAQSDRLTKDPRLEKVMLRTEGGKPRLVIEATFPGSGSSADLFVEAPDAIYLPVPKKVGQAPDSASFEVDLSEYPEVPDLKGKALTVTMVSGAGQSEATWVLK